MEPLKPSSPRPGQKPPGRNYTNIIVALLVVAALALTLFLPTTLGNTGDKKTFTDLVTLIKEGTVSKLTVSEDKERVTANIYKSDKKDRNDVEAITFPNIGDGRATVLENIQNSLTVEEKKNFKIGNAPGEIQYTETAKSFFTQVIDNTLFQLFLQIAIIGAIALFIIRRLGDVNSRSMQFGATRARSYDDLPNGGKVKFEDVAGNQEAKLELTEVVDFLKRPAEYRKAGAKIPRGVLLVGSPGNGKTLLAKAVAGEAGVPFLFVSGSEFVEMFVGVGASRVRDLFKQAKKKAPCVIFIDEIDAVGRKRGSGMGNSNDEREQTLNQILVEMDGFESSDAIIVLAATNRADVLDRALLRPGRFDRQVTVTPPDRGEREQILKVHSKGKKFAKDVDFGIVAKRTAGFSGADLANLLNEAAILTVRDNSKVITNDIVREAIEKVSIGPALKSKVVTEDQRKLTAYHEAGHALVATVIPEADKVQKITIIPRGRAGGYTFMDQGEQDPMTMKRSKMLANLATLFGGYAVEKIYFGDVSTGPSNDLERATEIARRMVTKYGMSTLGPMTLSETKYTPDGVEFEESQFFSEESKKQVDHEVRKILEEAYALSEKIVKTHRVDLDAIANALLDTETLEYEEYNEIVAHLHKAK
jgi:cell division protease FtsH